MTILPAHAGNDHHILGTKVSCWNERMEFCEAKPHRAMYLRCCGAEDEFVASAILVGRVKDLDRSTEVEQVDVRRNQENDSALARGDHD